ncbi:MAG: hypothetical protein ACRETP_14340 [Steroidobacteraceae bacterium]
MIRCLLQVGAREPPSNALLASIGHLIVQEEGDGDFLNDSIQFINTLELGVQIAHGIGVMPNDGQVELVLWARDGAITYLELEPFLGARHPVRTPILESIRPYPDDPFGLEDDDEEVTPATLPETT